MPDPLESEDALAWLEVSETTSRPLYCVVCGKDINTEPRPFQYDLEGNPAHYDCIETREFEEER